jgi:gliding motility-associated-like protein
MIRYLYLSLFILAGLSATATHIVGGEIYYKLNNSTTYNYTVTVKVYIDCENGNAGAISSDNEIYISMWNADTRAYIDDFVLTRSSPTRLGNTVYACIKEPEGVCVDAYTYQTTMTINPGNDGVILAWQRCCRNMSISNIIDPVAAGYTAWTVIPANGTTNSSAYFSTIPPVYVCTNVPLQFKQPAIDPDGDSLVYELNTPFLGATSADPRPVRYGEYDQPTFRNLLWKSPYSTGNMMGGSPKLSINSSTGELNVTPTTIGQFVVGYTVKEYRNGVYVGETRRDYQFNVIECEFDVVANFTVPDGVSVNGIYTFGCTDTVCFLNKSYSKIKPYILTWDFGDINTTADTSHEESPCYKYPGNGDYMVTLKVKSEICEDIYYYGVRIRSAKPFNLGPDSSFCEDIEYTLDTKIDDAVNLAWNTGDTESSITVNKPGLYIANVSYGNCTYSDSVILKDDRVDRFPLPVDSLLCDTIDMMLDVGVEGTSYLWSTSREDTFRSVYVSEPGTYSVIVETDHCIDFDTIRLLQATKPSIDNIVYCGTPYKYTFEALEEAEFLWSTGSTDPEILIEQEGTFWIRITQRNCVHSDTFTVTNTVLNLDLGSDQHFCDRMKVLLDAGSNGWNYKWSTGEESQAIKVSTANTYIVAKSDSAGCIVSDTIVLSLTQSPYFDISNSAKICINRFTAYDDIDAPEGFSYLWSTGSTASKLTINKGGYYSLQITDDFGCSTLDSFYVNLDTASLPNDLPVPNAFSPNGDGLNDFFPYSVNITQEGYHLIIYTRWGEKVFDSLEDINQTNWDGDYNSTDTHNQAFIYYMRYIGCDGSYKNKKGYVYPLH